MTLFSEALITEDFSLLSVVYNVTTSHYDNPKDLNIHGIDISTDMGIVISTM